LSFLSVFALLSTSAFASTGISSAVPDIFGLDAKSGLGAHYDSFRNQVRGLAVVEPQNQQLRNSRQLTSSGLFEILHTLGAANDAIIYARGYTLDTCICGFNATDSSNSCSKVSAATTGLVGTYVVTFSYYNGATSCGTPTSVEVETFSSHYANYTACNGKTNRLNVNYQITTTNAYLSYPGQGLVTFHYGTSAQCNAGTPFTDYKYAGFTTCGETYLPCGQNTNSTTYYSVSANTVGVKTYKDATCQKQTANTQITATSTCYDGTFDDDIDSGVVQNYFTWLVLNYPATTNSNDDSVTLSHSTFGGLVAAVFISCLFGMFIMACACRYQQNSDASYRKPLSSNRDTL